jgi:RNA polymerase sigma-70 factor, ECF subfamily
VADLTHLPSPADRVGPCLQASLALYSVHGFHCGDRAQPSDIPRLCVTWVEGREHEPRTGKVARARIHRRDIVPQLGLIDSVPPATEATARPPLSVDSLYRAHAKTVARWAIRLLGPYGDYEDVVHEVFMVVKRRLHEFRGDAAVTTWLYEITVRVVQGIRKRGRWWSWITGHGQHPGRGQVRNPFVPSAESPRDPLAMLEAREQTRVLYRLLDELGEDQRTTLILYELEGLSGSEIAEITGASVATVWVRLSRARRRFLQRMRTWEARENHD